MSTCNACSVKLNRYDDAVQCSLEECNQLFHIACVNLTLPQYTDLKQSGKIKEWVCTNCRGQEKSEPASFHRMESRLKDFIGNQFKEMQKTLIDVQDSQSFMNEKYEDILKKLDELAGLKQEVMQLKSKLVEKDEEIDSLKNRLSTIEQYGRNKNLELREVTVQENENTEDIVLKVAKKLDVKVESSDIEACHRLPSKTGKIPTIIVQFHSRKIRDQLLQKKQKIVTNAEINGKGQGRIYISENLSPFYRDLFWKTRVKAKSLGYKFIWWKKDKILVRKNESTNEIITITNENDLNIKL